MAKRRVYLHVGPAVPGLASPHAALRLDPALTEAGAAVPEVSQEEMDRADVEIRRRHKALGLTRKEVEGTWAHVCRKAFKVRGDVVISQPGFIDAEYRQVALALDGLVGLQVHLVLTPATTGPDDAGPAPTDLAGQWAKFVKPGRIHVLPVGDPTTPAELGERLGRLLLVEQSDDLQRRAGKLEKKRRKLTQRLARLGAA